MFESLERIEESRLEISRKSRERCGENLEKLRELILSCCHVFWKNIRDIVFPTESVLEKSMNSLVFAHFLELPRVSNHILFLCLNGLYRNAYDSIRYALESVIQALYIDSRHPETSIEVKIEILKEVENKREYHANRLVDELEIPYKDRIKEQYKRLSQIIHPSHEQVMATLGDVRERKGIPVVIDCSEIENIFMSMRMMYDIFFFLTITHFPEFEESMRRDSETIKTVKSHKMYLLSKALKVRLL